MIHKRVDISKTQSPEEFARPIKHQLPVPESKKKKNQNERFLFASTRLGNKVNHNLRNQRRSVQLEKKFLQKITIGAKREEKKKRKDGLETERGDPKRLTHSKHESGPIPKPIRKLDKAKGNHPKNGITKTKKRGGIIYRKPLLKFATITCKKEEENKCPEKRIPTVLPGLGRAGKSAKRSPSDVKPSKVHVVCDGSKECLKIKNFQCHDHKPRSTKPRLVGRLGTKSPHLKGSEKRKKNK